MHFCYGLSYSFLNISRVYRNRDEGRHESLRLDMNNRLKLTG
jgi:hypothetical protein